MHHSNSSSLPTNEYREEEGQLQRETSCACFFYNHSHFMCWGVKSDYLLPVFLEASFNFHIKIPRHNLRKCDKVAGPRCCVWVEVHLSKNVSAPVRLHLDPSHTVSNFCPRDIKHLFLLCIEWMSAGWDYCFEVCPLSLKIYKSKLPLNFFLSLHPWSLNTGTQLGQAAAGE